MAKAKEQEVRIECDVCDNAEIIGGEISTRTLEDDGWYLGDISALCPEHAEDFLSGGAEAVDDHVAASHAARAAAQE